LWYHVILVIGEIEKIQTQVSPIDQLEGYLPQLGSLLVIKNATTDLREFMDYKRKSYICYECEKIFPIPNDWVGSSYVLLETHYLNEHGVDIRSKNWISKHPKRLTNKLIELEEKRLKWEDIRGGSPADAPVVPDQFSDSILLELEDD